MFVQTLLIQYNLFFAQYTGTYQISKNVIVTN